MDAFDTEITSQEKLKVLCLDRNALTALPEKMKEWTPKLEELMVRHNQLSELASDTMPSSLQVLHISSNQLTHLDALIKESVTSHCPNLTHLYANANQLTSLPMGIVSAHEQLQRLVISHNDTLAQLPDELWQKIDECGDNGNESDDDEGDNASGGCVILWQPNPTLKKPGTDFEGEDSDGKAPGEQEMDQTMEE